MSRRITLTDFETEQIVLALTSIANQVNLDYQVILCGKAFYQRLINRLQPPKLKDKP